MNNRDPQKNFERWKSKVYLSKMNCIVLILRFDLLDSYSNIWFDFTMIVTSNCHKKMQKQNIFYNSKKWSIIFICWTDPIFFITNISGIESITIEIEENDIKKVTHEKIKKATSSSEDYIFHFWLYTLPHTFYGRGHFYISQIDLEVWFIVSRQIHVIFGQIVSSLHSIVKSIAE